MLLKGWIPSNIWGFGSLKTLLGRGMWMKCAQKLGELSAWSTDNITSIPLLKLWISCMFHSWDRISNMLPRYGIPIFRRTLTNWRRYKSLHCKCAQTTGWLAMMICLLVVISLSENQVLISQISFLYQLVNDFIVYPSHGVSRRNQWAHFLWKLRLCLQKTHLICLMRKV